MNSPMSYGLQSTAEAASNQPNKQLRIRLTPDKFALPAILFLVFHFCGCRAYHALGESADA